MLSVLMSVCQFVYGWTISCVLRDTVRPGLVDFRRSHRGESLEEAGLTALGAAPGNAGMPIALTNFSGVFQQRRVGRQSSYPHCH